VETGIINKFPQHTQLLWANQNQQTKNLRAYFKLIFCYPNSAILNISSPSKKTFCKISKKLPGKKGLWIWSRKAELPLKKEKKELGILSRGLEASPGECTFCLKIYTKNFVL
jgi:hypothetical protein